MSMLEQVRQVKVNAFLTALLAIPGVKNAWSDDWDSVSIKIFIKLDWQHSANYKEQAAVLRKVKAGIKKLGEFEADYPVMQYAWSAKVPGINRERYKTGYDRTSISLNYFV